MRTDSKQTDAHGEGQFRLFLAGFPRQLDNLNEVLKMQSKNLSKVPYELVDAERMHQANPTRLQIPSRMERENIPDYMNVKLIFKFYNGDRACEERMWVIVKERMPDHYVGTLNNHPSCTSELHAKDEVIFHPEHVIEIMTGKEMCELMERLTEAHNKK